MGIAAAYDRRMLDEFLSQQYDVVTRQQLLECGMTRSAIQHRVSPGSRWQIILPGVYAACNGPVRAEQREVAAMLHAGPGAIITGAFAARHFGLVAAGPDYIDVLVPAQRRRQNARFVRLIRSTRMPDSVFRVGPLRIAGPARAVADAVRGYRDLRAGRSLVCGAIQRKQCTLTELATELREGPKRGAAVLHEALRDAATGIWSTAEGDLMRLIKRSRLPEPEYNVALYAADGTLLGVVDAWWQRAGVAAEVDSKEFHFSEDDWRETMRRHNRITKHGVQLLHFPPRQIKDDGATILADLRDAIVTGLKSPPLPIRAVPRGINGTINTP